MRLNHLTVTNYKRLQDVDIEIREHLVLVGANDVGKTSLLTLIDLTLVGTLQQLYQGLSVADLGRPDSPLVVKATLADFTDDERAAFPDEITVSPDGTESMTIELEAEVSVDDAEQLSIRRIVPDTGRGLTREQANLIGWHLLPASRSSGTDFVAGRKSPLKALLAATDLGVEGEQLRASLDTFNDRLDENAALKQLRTDLAGHLSKAMPKHFEPDDLSLRTAEDPAVDLLDGVALFVRESDVLKAIGDQSDGVRQLMTLTFFDLARSAANIVAVDEPELHLHSSSQRTVAELFALGGSQRLLVTHSPFIVQRFEPRHVAVVTAGGYLRQIQPARFSAVEKELANWWSPGLLEALTARHTLLVEGAADRILVEAAARARGIGLDRLGVCILELGGAEKFSHVNRLLGKEGFNLNLLGLVDKAESNPWISGLGVKPKNVNVSGVFVCDRDLEDEYTAGMTPPALAQALIEEGVCRQKGLLQATGADDLVSIGAGAISDFVRARKVVSAVAAGRHLTAAHIAAMPAMSGLMNAIEAL